MSTRLDYLAYVMRNIFKAVVKDRNLGIHKLESLAAELDMSLDYVNNRLFGKVEIDDNFLKTSFDWLLEHAPDYACRWECPRRVSFNFSSVIKCRCGKTSQPTVKILTRSASYSAIFAV